MKGLPVWCTRPVRQCAARLLVLKQSLALAVVDWPALVTSARRPHSRGVAGSASARAAPATSTAYALRSKQPTAPAAPARAAHRAQMPQIVVRAPKQKPRTVPPDPQAPSTPQPEPTAPPTGSGRQDEQPRSGARQESAAENRRLDLQHHPRNDRELPQADNTPIDKVILQMPGVSYNSAVSNPSFHVRNEYANVQIQDQRRRGP